jgi:multiple sugar transport system permease protein
MSQLTLTDTDTAPDITLAPVRARRRRLRLTPGGAIRLVILWGFALFCLIPLVWLLLAPSKDDAGLIASPLGFGSIQRYFLSWQHLAAYDGGAIYLWLLNSVGYAVGALLITVIISLPAAYALATMRFRGRKLILVATLFAMVVPAAAMVLPLFMEINAMRLVNTPASVILPAAFFPFGVYLAFVYFSSSMPPGILEAARIDGCSEFGVFVRVALPLAKPVVGLVVFFSFIANWNNYFLPYVMLTDSSRFNLPVGLGALISGSSALRPSSSGDILQLHYPEAAMAGLVVVAPIAILFIVFQRFLVRGILAGSTTG